MHKPILFATFITCAFLISNARPAKSNGSLTNSTQVPSIPSFNSLKGTWIRHNREGFALIEINDTANVMYYEFADREYNLTKHTKDRYWYYKSKARMAYWNSSAIMIGTDKFRFDYKIKGDILIEFDKMGDQGMFVKVVNDNK
jgi:hypothetical protein